MSSQQTITILKCASAVLIGFGLLIALAALPATAGPVRILTDLIFWPIDGTQSVAAPVIRLFCAISGGMLAGWGLLLWQVATRLYPRDPALARRMILTSIGVWFVVDSIASVIAGAPLNAALNVGFLLAFVIPLWRRSVAATA